MRRYQPALLGGLFIGVLSSLPVIGSCCCLWVVAGGVLTAYLQQQRRADPLDAAEAALGGVIAGIIGALITVPISAMVALSPEVQERAFQFLEQLQLSPDASDNARRMLDGPMFVLLMAAVFVPVFAVFSMLGALLGLAIFRKKTPPAAPTPLSGGPESGAPAQ